MQLEMEEGGRFFFDLFVAMCNHMVGLPRLVFDAELANITKDDLGTISRSPFTR